MKIITGKDQGKSGKVLAVLPQRRKVVVEGLNVVKKHVRPRRQGEKGEIISVPRPLDISNVQIACGRCGKGVRTGFRLVGKTRIRVCVKCKEEL